jgi:hypothetical protein
MHEFLSQNHSVSKTNHLNWSSESEDIIDLKSTIFKVFWDDKGTAELITFDRVFNFLPY